MDIVSKDMAMRFLLEDAESIKNLLKNQKNSSCIAQCKAFEEIVDTQMYGFSKQVFYAVRLNILSDKEGQLLMANLEKELNQLYAAVYDEMNKGGQSVGKKD